MKLTVGWCQKIGQPNIGSLGANCHLEFELDDALLKNDPGRFEQCVYRAFQRCRRAVEKELAQASSSRNGHEATNGSGHSSVGHKRHATQGQLRALNAIAHRRDLNLARELIDRFNINDLQQLTSRQASKLIDDLNQQP